MTEDKKVTHEEESVIDLSQIFSKTKKFFKGIFDTTKSSDGKSDVSGLRKAAPYIFLILILSLSIYLRTMSAYLPITEQWAESSILGQARNTISSAIDQQYPNIGPNDKQILINQEIQKFTQTSQYHDQVSQASQFFKSQLQNENGQTYLVAIDPYHWYRYARNFVNTGMVGDRVNSETGQEWDDLRRAPYGTEVGTEFHMYLEAYLHKFFKIFNPNLDLMTTAFYLPVLLASLAIIPAFFLAKKKGGNVAGIIAGTIVAVHPSFLSRTMGGFSDTDPYNVMVPLFVMWFFIEAFESKTLKKGLAFTVLTIATLIFYSVAWSGWWYIFLFVIGMISIYFVWQLFLQLYKNKKPITYFWKNSNLRKDLILSGSFVLGTIFIMNIKTGGNFIKSLFGSAVGIATLKDVAKTTIWPNVLTTVAELNPASFLDMVNTIGGKTAFMLAFIGMLLLLVVNGKNKFVKEGSFIGASLLYYMSVLSNPNSIGALNLGFMSLSRELVFIGLLAAPIFAKMIFNIFAYTKQELKDSNLDIKYVSLLIVWCMGTVYGASRGMRFIMLLMPAFALGLGIFGGLLFKAIVKYSEKALSVSKSISIPLASIVIIFLILGTPVGGSPIKDALSVAENEVPSMNDAWYESLTGIRDDSDSSAIIGSWWDFGHWFRAIGERKVFFDGASQGFPAAHWMGQSLISSSELESVGTLRYMACGRDNVYNNLTGRFGVEPLDAIEIIDKITKINVDKAREILESYDLTSEQVEDTLFYSHCAPPEIYYITSEDMVGKGGVWGHFGSWDFTRASMYNRVHGKSFSNGTEILKSDFNLSEEEAQSTYYEIQTADANQWITGWPGYVGSGSACSKRATDLYLCDVSISGQGTLRLVFNVTSYNLGIVAGNNQFILPAVFSYVDDNGEFQVKSNANAQVPYGFTMVRENGGFKAIIMDPLQVDSMFTRLFFHEGAGLDYFEKFSDKRGIIGGRIIVWKVKWDEFLSDIGDYSFISDDDVVINETTQEA